MDSTCGNQTILSESIISQTEISELTKYLNDLLEEIDTKTALLKSSSPKNNQNINDNNISISSYTIQYTSSPDNDDFDITNVAAYQDVDDIMTQCSTVVDHTPRKTQHVIENDGTSSTDFDSIDSDMTLFSPVSPVCKSPKFESQGHSKSMESLNTISTIDTICRPALETQLIEINPFVKMENAPFYLFNMSHLDSVTTGYRKLGSRLVSYYGSQPYTYSNNEHKPREFEENSYLLHILSYIRIVLPELKFNSAMIHKYDDGQSFMPHHSDDESCIENGSDIVSISLGDSRWMEFKNKDNGEITKVQLMHGDILTMSQSSQSRFTHAITAEPGKEARMSITLRQIIPPHTDLNKNDSQSTVTDFLCQLSEQPNDATFLIPDGYQVHNENQVRIQNTQPSVEPPSTNGYQRAPFESDPFLNANSFQGNDRVQRQSGDHRAEQSQFSWYREGWQPSRSYPPRDLPPRTASTTSRLQRHVPPKSIPPNQASQFPHTQLHPTRQGGHRTDNFKPFKTRPESDIVFISSSMFADLDPIKLSSNEINAHVFFYRGADSYQMMDRLRRDTKAQNLAKQNTVSKVFILTGTNNVDAICNSRQSLRDACSSVSQTISYVQSLFGTATLNIINILPRVYENRKEVISQLNSHIKSLVVKDASGRLNFVDTQTYRLFSLFNGTRKSDLFKKVNNNDNDNVHLNTLGVTKLGRHLKYLAHC